MLSIRRFASGHFVMRCWMPPFLPSPSLAFFADVGPLTVFVSRHAMPADLQEGYDPARELWQSEDREVELRAGAGVRLRIMGLSVDAADISAIGTVADDYLGLVSAAEAAVA
mmetsp:Transcript_8824/g.15012  ORF Transcript_8824/g.15012 Transcript_8824/m.15012 type:complete len:112 (+) Transcript_8824:255-590(+)